MSTQADLGLLPGQFDELNKRFYGANPVAYLTGRLRSLMVYAGAPDAVLGVFQEGVRVGRVEMNATEVTDSVDDEAHAKYAMTETVVLLHHASEALLRLFFAHELAPACPWLEVSRMRVPRAFKNRVDGFLGDVSSAQTDRVARTLLGASAEDMRNGEGQWRECGPGFLQATEALLRTTARRVLDESDLYNAAKHGLAVLPQNRAFRVIFPDEIDIDISTEGMSLTFLELRRDDDRKRWAESTRWINTDVGLAYTHLVIRQIENLWGLAKMRYCGERSAFVLPPTTEQLATLQGIGSKPYLIPAISIPLAYTAGE